MPNPEFYNEYETAKRLGVELRGLQYWIKKGIVAPSERDKHKRCFFTSEDIEAIRKLIEVFKEKEGSIIYRSFHKKPSKEN